MLDVLNLSYTNISLLTSIVITFTLSIFSLFSWLINKKDKLSFWIFIILVMGTINYANRIFGFSIQNESIVIIKNRFAFVPFYCLIWAGYYHTLTYTQLEKSRFGKYLFDYYTPLVIIITLFTPLMIEDTLRTRITVDGFSWLSGQPSIFMPLFVLITVFQQIYIIFILYRSKSPLSKEIYILIGTWILMIFFIIYEIYVIMSFKEWIKLQEFIMIPLAFAHFFIRILENSRLHNNLNNMVNQKTEALSLANKDIEKKYGELLKTTEKLNLLDDTLKTSTTTIDKLNTELSFRERMHDELVKSENRWQFAVDGSNLGLWDWDLLTNEVFFSKQWKAMLGFADDEISNNYEEWDKRIHPDDRKKVFEDLESCLNGNTQIYNSEYRLLCKDETYKWIMIRGKIIDRTENNTPARMIGTHTDITEHKQAEKEKEKTAKIIGVTEMAGAAAHEINQPLQSILLLSEYVSLKLSKDNPNYKHVENISNECIKIGKITKNIQKIAKIAQYDTKKYIKDEKIIDIHSTKDGE